MKRDSLFIQSKSLEGFMDRLGYSAVTSSKGLLFVGRFIENKAFKVISFQNAVIMHNKVAEFIVDGDVSRLPGGYLKFHTYLLRQAEAAKIVDRVSLCFRDGHLTTTRVWVKFTNDTGTLFQKALGPLLEEPEAPAVPTEV